MAVGLSPILRRLNGSYVKALHQRGEHVSEDQETMSSIRLVKSLGAEEHERERFCETSRRVTRSIPIRKPKMAERGRVLLVGAGPGDPELITVRGAKALARADVILYDELATDHPIDLTRWQVVYFYLGSVCHIYSGCASGENDLALAVETAVINKREGVMGLISGSKSFQKPMSDGVTLLNAIQDVFLCDDVTIA